MNEIQSRIKMIFDEQLVNQQAIRNTSFKERSAKLKSIEKWLMDHKEDIRNAMHQDYRKPSSEVDLTELWAVLNEIRHIRRYLKKWMRPKKVNSTLALATA